MQGKPNDVCPNKEYNGINGRPVQDFGYGKTWINDWENMFAYWKESEQSGSLENRLVCSKYSWGDLGGATSGKFCNFFLCLNRHKIFI